MTCDEVEKLIVESFDSPAGESFSEAVADHLAVCPTCRSKAAEMRSIHGDLLAAAKRIQTQSIVPAVLARIDARQHKRHFHRLGWAMVACLVFCVGGWMIFFATESVTLAEVKQALATQNWYHVRYDCGQTREMWSCPAQGKSYWIDFDGRVGFTDEQLNLRQTYSANEGSISQDKPVVYTDGVIPQWKPSTVADEWANRFDSMSKHSADCERHDETNAGRRLVRFDCYGTDGMGKRMLFSQLWVDAVTHLPVKERDRLQLAERDQWGREWQTGEFDFPVDGPRDIYQLGVPKNAAIDISEDEMARQVRELIARCKAERAKFPQQYRAVCWPDSKDGEIDIIYQNGKKLRFEHYFRHPMPDLVRPNQTPLTEPVTEEKILEWARTQIPIDLYLSDGERDYSRNNDVAPPATQPEVQVTLRRGSVDLFPQGHRPAELMWPFLNIGGPAEMLDKNDDTPPGWVGFRVGGHGNSHHDYYLDPAKALACVKMISWEKRGDKFEKTREDDLLDFHQVGGQWCPGKHYFHDYGDRSRGIWPSESVWHIAVTALNETDFLPNLFDGNAILHGAKVEGY